MQEVDFTVTAQLPTNLSTANAACNTRSFTLSILEQNFSLAKRKEDVAIAYVSTVCA